MAWEEIIEQVCDEHGIYWHILIHEAGHVVAALDYDVAFRAVVVYAEGAGPQLGGLYEAGATVDTGPDPAAWVEPRRMDSFRFVCAGAAAEVALLGHALEGSWESDIKEWRKGSGNTDPMSEQQFIEALGANPEDVFEEVTVWAGRNRNRIEGFAAHMRNFKPPFEVSYAEVSKLLG